MDARTRPLRRLAPLVLGLVACAALGARPTRAGEPDPETRFHDAYVQEVIQGEVAEAAKVYLDLQRGEATPPHLRAEARFRFGVCLVLLGRADEARTTLGALAADEQAPAALRARAKAYLDGIAGLGVGGELEKRLHELVFDLARVNPMDTPAVYRDFEILGATAVPFLKRLLAHEDEALRQHAYRLLARMDVEGLGSLWTPRIPFAGQGFNAEVGAYLRRHADEAAALEQRLLALDDDTLGAQLARMVHESGLVFSLDFARALVNRLPKRALDFLPASEWTPEVWSLVLSWLDRDDETFTEEVTRLLLSHAKGELPPEGLREEAFPKLLPHVAALGWGWSGRNLGKEPAGLRRLAEAMPTTVLLQAVWEVTRIALSQGPSVPGQGTPWNPLWPGSLDVFLQAPLADRDLTDAEREAWERTWRAAFEGLLRIFRPGSYDIAVQFRPLAGLLRKLPPERARALLLWARGEAEGTPLGSGFLSWLPQWIPLETPADVETLVVGLEAAQDTSAVSAFAEHLSDQAKDHARMSCDVRAALFRATPRIATVGDAGTNRLLTWGQSLAYLSEAVPPAEASAILTSTLEASAALPEMERLRTVGWLVPSPSNAPAGYFAAALVPALRRAWETLDAEARDRDFASLTWTIDEQRAQVAPEDERAIAAFLREHLSDLAPRFEKRLADRQDLFPPETWVPYASPNGIQRLSSLPQERRDEVAHALVERAEPVNESVLLFVKDLASPDVAQAIFDRLLASEDDAVRGLALESLDVVTGKPASVVGLAEALRHLGSTDDPDLDQLALVARIHLNVKPSQALFAAGKRLLQAENRRHLLAGIEIAQSLGHPALLDDLKPLLRSLDERVRTGARLAIEQIEQIQAK